MSAMKLIQRICVLCHVMSIGSQALHDDVTGVHSGNGKCQRHAFDLLGENLIKLAEFSRDKFARFTCSSQGPGPTLKARVLNRGCPFTMLSRGQVHDLTLGSHIALECEYNMETFRMFDNPVLWEKSQQGERTRINIVGVVQEPFANMRRFEVTFQPHPPRYRLGLHIREASLEDSGNYTCEVRGERSTVLGSVTYTVHVRGPITSLRMTRNDVRSGGGAGGNSDSLTELLLSDGDVTSLGCVSLSGCPAPPMSIRLGEADITKLFERTEQVVEVSGVRGMRSLQCVGSRWTSSLSVRGQDDGRKVRCSVSSPGLSNNHTDLRLHVQYAPLIVCEPAMAQLDDEAVPLSCTVRSRPSPTSIHWIVDSNHTRVTSAQLDGDYWTLVGLQQDGTEGLLTTKLFLKRAREDSFREYKVVAENVIGRTEHGVALMQGIKTTEQELDIALITDK